MYISRFFLIEKFQMHIRASTSMAKVISLIVEKKSLEPYRRSILCRGRASFIIRCEWVVGRQSSRRPHNCFRAQINWMGEETHANAYVHIVQLYCIFSCINKMNKKTHLYSMLSATLLNIKTYIYKHLCACVRYQL